tara:strand:+ start:8628 stop:9266 length:639 start_codon:yes stop_codon:yes gene_type:complete
MSDLGVLTYIDNLNIQNISIVSLDPTIFRVSGEDFNTARKVYINSIEAPRFEVVDNNTILLELPLGINAISSISILSSGPTKTTKESDVLLEFPSTLVEAKGITSLAQRVVKILLTTRASNKFAKSEGGNLQSYLASTDVDKQNSLTEITSSVQQVSEYIFEDPAFKNLPPEEQLASLEVISTEWDRNNQTLNIDLKIINNVGQSTVSTVEV